MSASSEFSLRSPPKSVLTDIVWWRDCLSRPFCGTSIQSPPLLSDLHIWVDASTSWGIGVVFNGHWAAWKLQLGWNSDGRNIGWAEMVAIELGLLFTVSFGYNNLHFKLFSDNQGVIHALDNGRSRSPQQNRVLQRIVTIMRIHSICISISYISSSNNPADRPSRGLIPSDSSLKLIPPPLPNHLLSFLSPLIPAEAQC